MKHVYDKRTMCWQNKVEFRVGARGLGQVTNICSKRPLARRSRSDGSLCSRYFDRQKTKIILSFSFSSFFLPFSFSFSQFPSSLNLFWRLKGRSFQFLTKFVYIQSGLFRKTFARTVVSTVARIPGFNHSEKKSCLWKIRKFGSFRHF